MGFFSDAWDSAKDAVSEGWDSVKDWGSDIAEAGREFVDDPIEGAKSLVKAHFKPVEWLAINPLEKTWENKYGRMGMLAAGAYLGAPALAGATGAGTAAGTSAGVTGTASAAGAGSAGLSGTVAPIGSVVGAASPSAAAGAGAAAASGAGSAAIGGGSGGLGLSSAAGGAAGGSGAGMLSQAANWASNNQLLASTGLNMAGQGLSGYMQSRAAEEERKRMRRQQINDRNARSAYGVTYDGTEDAGIDTGGMLNEAIGNYRPGQRPQFETAGPQNVADPNAQQTPWWQRQGGIA